MASMGPQIGHGKTYVVSLEKGPEMATLAGAKKKVLHGFPGNAALILRKK